MIYYEYSDTPHKFRDVWIAIVASIECILNFTRGGNIRSENVMLLMAVSNARRENVIWNFPRCNAHFSFLDVRNAWKRSRNSAMWRSHTSATRVFLFRLLKAWKYKSAVNFENGVSPRRRQEASATSTCFTVVSIADDIFVLELFRNTFVRARLNVVQRVLSVSYCRWLCAT